MMKISSSKLTGAVVLAMTSVSLVFSATAAAESVASAQTSQRFDRLSSNSTPPNSPPGLIGFATVNGATTGGLGGATNHVSTVSAFKAAIESSVPLTIFVQGNLNLGRKIVDVQSQKTIIGQGTNTVLTGNLRINDATNVIIQNLKFVNPGTGNSLGGAGAGDGLTIDGSQHIWVDHCTFQDCADGELDITHRSDFITVSWCKFYYTSNSLHNLANLIGHSRNNAAEDAGKLHVTFHHNWWSTLCIERMPRARFGQIHVFNNYYNCPGNHYCVRAGYRSQILVEHNYFEGVNTPYEYYTETPTGGSPQHGLIRLIGNTTVNCSDVNSFNDDIFVPPYAYAQETPAAAKTNIIAGAGAGMALFP
jgi:pectate lyase